MKINEATFREIIKDYIDRRSEFKTIMCWRSKLNKEKIEIALETLPYKNYKQKSLRYKLEEENVEMFNLSYYQKHKKDVSES